MVDGLKICKNFQRMGGGAGLKEADFHTLLNARGGPACCLPWINIMALCLGMGVPF